MLTYLSARHTVQSMARDAWHQCGAVQLIRGFDDSRVHFLLRWVFKARGKALAASPALTVTLTCPKERSKLRVTSSGNLCWLGGGCRMIRIATAMAPHGQSVGSHMFLSSLSTIGTNLCFAFLGVPLANNSFETWPRNHIHQSQLQICSRPTPTSIDANVVA
jgi:hypothetical protein